MNQRDRNRALKGDLDLAGADLTGANLANADLRKAIIRGADMRGGVLDGQDLMDLGKRGAVID